jgi:hypothetical protein
LVLKLSSCPLFAALKNRIINNNNYLLALCSLKCGLGFGEERDKLKMFQKCLSSKKEEVSKQFRILYNEELLGLYRSPSAAKIFKYGRLQGRKVKLSLCLTNEALHYEDVRGSGFIRGTSTKYVSHSSHS